MGISDKSDNHVQGEDEKRALRDARSRRVDEVLAESEVTGEEYCVGCWSWMGFQKSLHIHHQERHADGRSYVEGCGQVCTSCNAEEKKDLSRAIMYEN